jgi:hypothetical protein
MLTFTELDFNTYWPGIETQVLTTVAQTVNQPVENVTVESATPGSIVLVLRIIGFVSLNTAQYATIQLKNVEFNDGPDLGPVQVESYIVPPSIIPLTTICFPAGTPVLTDQGLIHIDQIDTEVHTLNRQQILYITKTISLDRFLVCFQKDALGLGVPNADTIMTKDHKIMYNGQLAPAYKFVNKFHKVKKVWYTGEFLYNVLLREYTTMRINNLVCETLHPKNLIANLYTNSFTDNYNNNIIEIMNYSINKKDYPTYKRMVRQLT